MISHAKLPLPIEIQSWKSEIHSLAAKWTSHFNYQHYDGDWTVLPLRSPGGRSDNIIADLLNQDEYSDTAVLDDCPSIKRWLSFLECPLMSVRLLNLKSKSVIKEHRDNELSFENGEARLHVPVYTNPGVEFYINNKLVKMNEGECLYINANLPHRVSNNGTTDRIHLVIDCKVNEWLKDLFNRSEREYATDDQPGKDLINIIRELRIQNTITSNNIADELAKSLKVS